MGAYDFNFDVPAGERYQPSPERVAAWQRLLPTKNFGFAPPITDRAAWDPWQSDPFGQRVLSEARELVAGGFPAYTDATYLDCLETESVTKINEVLPIVRTRQATLLLAEAIFDQGEFLGEIGADFDRVAQVSSWVHPNNDLERRNLRQETREIDLVTAHHAAHYAAMLHVLGARLPEALQQRMRAELHLRAFEPLRRRLETGHDVYWWVDVTHNWNSVCLACLVQAAAACLPANERAWWFATGEMLVKYFRESFNNDGFCTEGVGYWGYGVSNYIFISEMFRLGTGGLVDLFDEPKMSRVALFPDRSEIEPGLFPTFADCRLGTKPLLWARHWLDNRRGAALETSAELPGTPDAFATMRLGSFSEPTLWMFHTHNPNAPRGTRRPLGLRHWFEDSSLLIARPGATTGRRFSGTFLGGNNGVNHNHNDLGTFTVCLDGRALIVDPGMETYSMRTFSEHRYDSQLLNSYGHPVPRVAGRLQEAGAEWQTRVLETEFTDDVDRVVFDLKRAYDVPTLRRLEREFIYDRTGDGSISIVDTVEFSEPADFESVLITFGEVDIQGNRIVLRDSGSAITADVEITGANLAIDTDTINQPPHPQRLALRCDRPVTHAVVRTHLRPL
ncbi:heparinase II/III family protein [Synoicihabitans lomoniglobus]|uniref:Heparinase II/III family protein n=1 Tax=Synoicihabitans lomoniglobus TaxID=2909285 RepID=A0AAF0CM84_9BACT|nr:heparinase II/III family protein [Opitutaceae bacterium LMO-M01]WED63768.1 heparinase II/III family protein [Opitutaceae bacterium LMO-M01]